MYQMQICLRNGLSFNIRYSTKEAAEEAYAKIRTGHIVELSHNSFKCTVNTSDIAMYYIDSKDPE